MHGYAVLQMACPYQELPSTVPPPAFRPAMADHGEASRRHGPCFSLGLLLLLSASHCSMSFSSLDDDDGGGSFSGVPPRRSLRGAAPESFSVLSRNSSNSSGSPFCRLLALQVLDLSNNQLTGELPDCWWDLRALQFMDLSNNSFSGEIPAARANHNCSLESVHLAGNGFSGTFPPVLKGCDSLATLDLGNNRFFGAIPPWIGSHVPSLRILSLRSNNFTGEIPPELSQLSHLQLLDMANNSLTGSIPLALGSLKSMRRPQILQNQASLEGQIYQDRIDIIWKGKDVTFQKILSLVTGIDLSSNSLSQCIPEELTDLHGLLFLNLSRNHLSCSIPANIGSFRELETLDLHSNELEGAIPPSISTMWKLNTFNVSNNHLSGKIPDGSQIQTLTDPSIYSNNQGLCGFPLASCQNASIASDEGHGGEDDQWLYLCVIAGIVFGFWLWFGILFTVAALRYYVFFCVDSLQCKIMQKVSGVGQFLSKGNTAEFL